MNYSPKTNPILIQKLEWKPASGGLPPQFSDRSIVSFQTVNPAPKTAPAPADQGEQTATPTHSPHPARKLGILLPLVLALIGLTPVPAAVASPNRADPSTSLQVTSAYKPPNDGAPGRRKDAGSRPFCPQQQQPLSALVPATNFSLTANSHPSFWVYVPYTAGAVELTLKHEQTKDTLYTTHFQVKNGPGIMRFPLPAAAPGLKSGTKYRWRFDFFCNPASTSDVLSVNGVVLRQAPSTQTPSTIETDQPFVPPSIAQAAIYASDGLWHETLNELAALRRQHPRNSAAPAEWAALLQHPMVRLNAVSEEPIVPCCTPAR